MAGPGEQDAGLEVRQLCSWAQVTRREDGKQDFVLESTVTGALSP